VVELKHSLILRMLRASTWWNEDLRLHLALAALLIADADSEWYRAIFQGLREGRYRVDADLVVALYEASPKALRKLVVGAAVFGYLSPKDFEHRFLQTYRSGRPTVLERRDLIESLEKYLWRQPNRVGHFAPFILELLRSPEWELRLRGLWLVRLLRNLPEVDRQRLLQATRDKSPEIRCQAFNGLCELAKRRAKITASLREFCMSPEARELAFETYKRDPDVDVQTCAYYFLKAREPRAGHKPPKGMPVPPPRRKRRRLPSP
jgi:hypothetical protein